MFRFVIHKRVDAATTPPQIRYWFTIRDKHDMPHAAGDMLTTKAEVVGLIVRLKTELSFTVEDSTGEN